MHPIVKAYLTWAYCFRRSLSEEAVGRDDWDQQHKAAWAFFKELKQAGR